MARLVVRLHGEQVAELALESGREYLIGRGDDADVHLSAARGISRHHLKVVERDGQWVCESLSKLLLMQKGGATLEIIELDHAVGFTLPPYEFQFDPQVAPVVSAEDEAAAAANLPGVYVPRVRPRVDESPDVTRTRLNNEATRAAQSNLVAYLKITYPDQTETLLKLEGQLWTAGRDPACEIHVESAQISRRHFELSRGEGGYFLTDLGSANGTKINDARVTAHEPRRLESGDEIRIQSLVMSFEIRDPQFANRLSLLPVAAVDPMFQRALEPWAANEIAAPATEYHGAPVPSRAALARGRGKGKWIIRGVIATLAVGCVVGSLLPEKKKPEPADGNKVAAWDGLTPEKKAIIKDSFALARNLYVQGKYALCQTELRKVHDLIPQYENSKELESFCEQGLELVRRQEDLDRQAREKAAIEQKITGYVDDCKAKLTAQSTVDETRVCLAPAIEMAPEHPLVVEMIHSAQMHEQERKFLADQKAAEDQKYQKGLRQFERAERLVKDGKLTRAIPALRAFLNTHFPRTEGLKEKARELIAHCEKELARLVGGFVAQCKQLAEKGQLKEAWIACDHAVKENAEATDAKALRDQMHQKLRVDMRAIYEDSVLEESMGNVDTAKEKWKKILNDDIEEDDYFTKARSKMQKYVGD